MYQSTRNRLFFTCTTISISISTSFILRLPCISYASFNITPNKYFMGVIETTFFADSINDCGIYCVRSLNCVFANYNINQRTCQIMSSKANSKDSTNDQQWTVLITDSTNNKNLGPLCENNTPCGNLYCRDVCSTDALVHKYQCLDISRDATPSLSSTYSALFASIYAIDGDLTTLAHSRFEHQSWFKLDLHYVYQIMQIVIFNRVSCCQERMNGNLLIVSVSDEYLNVPEIATLTSDLKQTFTGLFIGRYVFLVQLSDNPLQLAEINVFA
nr:uncharacterized protein LOC105848765 isoform X2 [Hydra vulgaris]